MTQIFKSQFKAKALAHVRAVETNGEPVIITNNSQPGLEIRPCQQPVSDSFVKLRGTVLFYQEPTLPVGKEDWEALK